MFLDEKICYAIISIILLVDIIITIKDFNTFFEVSESEFIHHRMAKTQKFPFEEYTFGARTENHSEKYIYAKSTKSNTTETIDCSNLSLYDFDNLMKELGIIGKKAPVNKLN